MAYDIDEVLELYRKESDLSKKTKNEALGHLTVYTRDDIERMQAHTLSDLLNTLRSFRYDENMFGMPDVLHQDPSLYSSDLVKIFINNYEITSAYTGSGLYIYGNIDLGFVDHVEIYEGSTSTNVNSEPSIVTIKIYSKDPKREFGGHMQVYAGSRGTNHENLSYGDVSSGLKYFVYGSRTDANRVNYTHQNHDLSRDYKDVHAFSSITYKNMNLDLEVIDHKMDPFFSYSMFATPQDSEIDYTLSRASTTFTFLDDESLKLMASFIRIDVHLDFNMDGTRRTTDIAKIVSLQEDQLISDALDDSLNLKLEKKQKTGANNLIFGVEFLSKRMHDVHSYNNDVYDTNSTYINNTISSLYVEDEYALSPQQIFSFSFKYNHYDSNNNKTAKVFDTQQFRIGYIFASKSDVLKIFFSHMELPTEQYALSSSSSLTQIDQLALKDITFAYSKSIGKGKYGFTFEYAQNENPTEYVEQKLLPKTYDNYSSSISFDYYFDAFNKLNSMAYLNRIHTIVDSHRQTIIGGFIRFLNRYRHFDFFNEAVYYRKKNTPVNGIAFNCGVRYKYTKDLIFSLKGTNIFDSAAESSYLYLNPVTYQQEELYYSPIDRLFTVSVEYSF
jgi:iron complex outermembrane receptor protein